MALFPDSENTDEMRYEFKKGMRRNQKTEANRYRRDNAPDRYKKEMPKGYKSKYSGRMV